MKVVITGATGSLGSSIMSRLVESGHEVTGLGRNGNKIEKLKESGFDVLKCSLENTEKMEQYFTNADCIIHCAAFAAPFGSKNKFIRTNVEGTRTVMQSALNKNINRVIVISSSSVFEKTNPINDHSDELPSKPPSHPYSLSKYLAEEVLNSFPTDMWIGLRPRAVFGKNDTTVLPRIKKLINSKRYLVIGNGKTMVDVTCMSNFLDAVECAISADNNATGRIYNISNGKPLETGYMMSRIAQKTHPSAKVKHIPQFPVKFLSHTMNIIGHLSMGLIQPNLTPYSVNQLTKRMVMDLSGAKEYLGWVPEQSFEDGLEETI
ncbi:MAG: NAD-dependent epimerase/dehydratase family protein [Candidatus Poseidoniales archaeon]|tara:strand:- start:1484 stop:2443 length:960 start_codon:yes stop_codon:yes gene_type:complete